MAVVLTPQPPVADWLGGLDTLLQRAPGFFLGRAVILDVAALPIADAELTGLIADLLTRGIRIVGLEGARTETGAGLPPSLLGGRSTGEIPLPDRAGGEPASAPAAAGPEDRSLLLDAPLRSGQSILFPDGDVTVIGSVASGAEIVAGGSIHVYGTLRGRALAGCAGNAHARIFCRKLEAELLAIDGIYKVADDIDPGLRGQSIQAWLEGDALAMSALD